MDRITVSTRKDKRKGYQTPFLPQFCIPEGLYIWNPELYFYMPFNYNSLNVKDIHKGSNIAFSLICFMLNTEMMRSVYVKIK